MPRWSASIRRSGCSLNALLRWTVRHTSSPRTRKGCRWEPEAWIWSSLGDYFFADLCSGWIRRFDPASGVVTDFASGFSAPVDLHVGANGGLYVLSRGAGAVHVIRFGGI
jgi:hypothetical protein